MTAILTVLITAQGLPNSLRIGLLISTIFLNFCTLLCALSFLPKTNLERLLWARNKLYRKLKPTITDNLYYFGDLQKYSSAELLEALNSQYFNNSVILPYGKESNDIAITGLVRYSIIWRYLD